jgi:hypothetical protein
MNGSDEKFNLIKLTHREHWIAHLMLYKAYEGSMTYAFSYLSKKGKLTNSKLYENAISLMKSSELQINNGIENKTVYNIEDVPEGFTIGRFTSEKTKKAISIKMKEKIWITDGVINKRIENTEKIPDGFTNGKTEFIKAKRDHAKGKIWINNGITNKYINENSSIPEGYRKGFIQKKNSKKRSDMGSKYIFIIENGISKKVNEKNLYLHKDFIIIEKSK